MYNYLHVDSPVLVINVTQDDDSNSGSYDNGDDTYIIIVVVVMIAVLIIAVGVAIVGAALYMKRQKGSAQHTFMCTCSSPYAYI